MSSNQWLNKTNIRAIVFCVAVNESIDFLLDMSRWKTNKVQKLVRIPTKTFIYLNDAYQYQNDFTSTTNLASFKSTIETKMLNVDLNQQRCRVLS